MNKQVTRKDDSVGSVVVEGPNIWTPWRTADEWQNIQLPLATGIYEMFCHDGKWTEANSQELAPAQDSEVVVNNDWEDWHKERATKDCASYQGIVYIGMTTNLKNRFGGLVASWIHSSSIKNIHGSRKKWNKDASIQAKYPLKNMVFRYMKIGLEKADASSAALETQENKNLLNELKQLWPDKGTNHYAPSAAAGIAYEDNELKKFIQCFNQLPVLNTDGPEGGYLPTKEALQEYFDWQEKQDEQEN